MRKVSNGKQPTLCQISAGSLLFKLREQEAVDIEAILGMVPMSVSTAPCVECVQLYVALKSLHGVDVDCRVVLLEKGRAMGDISVLLELSLKIW